MPIEVLRRVRLRLPVRTRLTGLYMAASLGIGSTLLTVVYLVVQHGGEASTRRMIKGSVTLVGPSSALSTQPPREVYVKPLAGGQLTADDLSRIKAAVRGQTMDETLHRLLVVSGISIAVLTVITMLAGWWLSGRALRPLDRITATARALSSRTLHERIALQGPDDELKHLADTFDGMLDRLELAFESQRRFVANASHELRTPLAIQRAALEIGLADPASADVAQVREELLAANRRTVELIDGLLLLARSDRGLSQRVPVDLAELGQRVLAEHEDAAAARGVQLSGRFSPVTVSGDPVLVGQLLANLVDNAIRYNDDRGRVRITVRASSEPARTGSGPAGEAVIEVANTGVRVPAEEASRLLEPFYRAGGERTGSAPGAGLGLSIVRSIALAHGGSAVVTAQPDGGLTVRIGLPVAVAGPPGERAPEPAGAALGSRHRRLRAGRAQRTVEPSINARS